MDLACFPMVPYANRIENGHFTFGTQCVRLKRNWEGDRHPLHGQGWRRPWTVIAATVSSARLSFEGGDDEWPWRYRAQQDFLLLGNTLSIRLAVENLSQAPMPVMLGLHPYFCDAGSALLQADVPRVWDTDEASLPIKEVATPSAWLLDTARSVTQTPLDHCFVGWDARATISWPDRWVVLEATNCHALHIYVPSGRDFFCLEPQSAPAGVLNRAAKEVPVVRPSEHCGIEVRFKVGVT